MKLHRPWLTILIGSILAGVAALSIIELQSSNGLLDDMTLIEPGAKLDSIKPKLGQEIGNTADPDEMIHIGSIKDRDFCQGKRLHRFVGAKWPWREVEVYTDKNDAVVFVTWQYE